ncbi:MAG: hypothetical protein H6719_03775 [Sandaracinaceae bacterium]|nr:hypothetical protein [Sandaracinaceae bacterium]
MRSPKERLLDALEAWQRERARERVARWRGDADALDEVAVSSRHARLRGPRARELYEDALDRGDLEGDERVAVEAALREAYVTGPRALGDARIAAALAAPIPYDSDFHRGSDLLLRLAVRPDGRTRRAIARALERTFTDMLGGLEERRGRVEEALELAAWLPAPPASAPVDAEQVLAETDEAWRELLERLAHAGGAHPEDWSDLVHLLRAPAWDDLVPRRSRPRRASAPLEELGFGEVLRRGAHVEPSHGGARAEIAIVAPSRDVRLAGGVELGVASERDFARALGAAAACLLAHPGLPTVLGRPAAHSVADAIGALCGHLLSDGRYVARAFGDLSPAQVRAARELALGVELFELRTAAAAHLGHAQLGRAGFVDEARDRLVRTWGVDAPPALASLVARDPGATARLAAARLAPARARALREQFDEDFWRNPRTAEPLRHGASRGAALTPDAWAAELGVPEGALRARMTELLG